MNNKTILLINPWIYDFAAYDFWAKPIGLLYLAGLLRECGFFVEYLDCLDIYTTFSRDYPTKNLTTIIKRKPFGDGKFYSEIIQKPQVFNEIERHYKRYGITPESFCNEIEKKRRPHLVFVTSLLTYWYPALIDVIRIVKRLLPGVPIVLGGIYATLCNEHAKKYSSADVVVSGRGEKFISGILKKFFGENFDIHGVKNIDDFPYPAFDLQKNLDAIPLMTSRGCPYQCSYCASSYLYNGFEKRSVQQVVEEIVFWNEKFGVRDFAFYDDALLYNSEEHFLPIMDRILKKGQKVRFHTPNGLHARWINKEVASCMYETNFKTVRLGFETASQSVQKHTGGKVNNDDLAFAVSNLIDAGFSNKEIGIYILVGLPGQMAQEVEETIAFVHELGVKPFLAEYSPIPHTSMWLEAVKSSIFDLVHEPLFHNNSILPCQWEGLTYKDYLQLKRLVRN